MSRINWSGRAHRYLKSEIKVSDVIKYADPSRVANILNFEKS